MNLQSFGSVKSREVEDILIACIDGLTGFSNAIEALSILNFKSNSVEFIK